MCQNILQTLLVSTKFKTNLCTVRVQHLNSCNCTNFSSKLLFSVLFSITFMWFDPTIWSFRCKNWLMHLKSVGVSKYREINICKSFYIQHWPHNSRGIAAKKKSHVVFALGMFLNNTLIPNRPHHLCWLIDLKVIAASHVQWSRKSDGKHCRNYQQF